MNKYSFSSNQKGFTLIEILLVIGIIAVLATVVIVALDPATRFQNARDARRLSDIQSILSATQQYIVDNKGVLPPGLTTTEKQIGTDSGGCAISGVCAVSGNDDCIDLQSTLERYLKAIPYDPQYGSVGVSHYTIVADANNIITVKACNSGDDTIDEVSR